MRKFVLYLVAVVALVVIFVYGWSTKNAFESNNDLTGDSPLILIQNGRLKEGSLALTRLNDDDGWALLGSLSSQVRDSVFRELINQALEHYAKGEFTQCENLLLWVEEHSGGDYEVLKVAQAELYLLKGKSKECTELLTEIAGVSETLDSALSAGWSTPLKDFYAANIMKNDIGLNPDVENLGIREDIYIDESDSMAATSDSSGVNSSASTSVATGVSSKTGISMKNAKKRPRGVRHPFSENRLSIERLNHIAENSYRGMKTKELVSIAGQPSRIIACSLPEDGLWKTLERTERWDYVDHSCNTGIAIVVLDGVVKSVSRYERKLK